MHRPLCSTCALQMHRLDIVGRRGLVHGVYRILRVRMPRLRLRNEAMRGRPLLAHRGTALQHNMAVWQTHEFVADCVTGLQDLAMCVCRLCPHACMLRIEKREHCPARQKQHPSPQFLRGTESAGSSSAGASHGSLDGRKSVLPAAMLWVVG